MTQNLGQTLKNIRESRGISLEEIAQKTHVRLEYLQAIEAEDEEYLPSRMHKRGFLRLYAGELGVEIDELQAKHYHLFQDLPENKSPIIDESEDNKRQQADEISSEKAKTESEGHQEDPAPEADTDSPFDEKSVDEDRGPDHKSALIFSSIGEILQTQRELLSLSIDDITEYTHIQKNYLVSMESGQFDQLPSPVQAKGMLANYVEFLNLDVDALLLQFADGLQMKRIESTQLSSQQEKRKSKQISSTHLQIKNFFSLDLLIMIFIFMGFAAFIIWGVNRILSVNQTGVDSTQIPEVADILLSAETASPTPQLSITTVLGEDPIETEIIGQEAQTPIFTQAVSNDPINILIIPRQRAWVQIITDTELVFEGRLIPGSAYDYSGDETVEVLTGNAGALQIYFNEQDVGSLGLVGQVLDLIFTKDGLIFPTPTNTPTLDTPEPSPTPTTTPSPTRTPIPTDTLQPTTTSTQVDD